MWDLIVSVPDRCLSFFFFFFVNHSTRFTLSLSSTSVKAKTGCEKDRVLSSA